MKERLIEFLIQIEKLGGDVRPLVFEGPAKNSEVIEIEQQLGYSIPEDFKKALLTLSAHCEFSWFLPDDFQLPDALKQIFSGELHWGKDFVVSFNQSKDRWVEEVFPDSYNEYDRVWHNKFVFQEVGNGDYISIDLSPSAYGGVVYLSHDDGEGHGYVMANSFSELLTRWTQIGCVGAEGWQWLPFCKNSGSGIDPECDNAILWKETIGLK